ncbi:MAG: SDR family NAD(P)-dependent oxidoreductase [Gammaproteobacteria bacterium]
MNKSIIITGGSTGIGEATVKRFSELGYQVFNLDKHEPPRSYSNTHFIACDVSDTKQIEQAVEKALQKITTLEAVVSCAGKYLSASIEETSESEFDDMFSVNVKGTFFLLKSVLPVLKKQQHGSVVIVASDQSLIGKTRSAAYGATKGAIGQLAKSTALDYAPFHVRVNAVCPGTIDTPLYRHAIERSSKKSGIPLNEIEASLAQEQPLGRIGTADEVAALICFLASDEAAFITGGLFPVDGGYTAQ